MMLFSNNPRDLPHIRILNQGPISASCLALNIKNYPQLGAWIRELPYRRITNPGDVSLVLTEKRGTCSTKHALLAGVALELGIPVSLVIGIYEMNEANTPGVGTALASSGLDCVPEAHVYLLSKEIRIDLTRNVGDRIIELDILHEEKISPGQITEYKDRLHRAFIDTWSGERNLTPETVCNIREACITALSAATR